MNPPKSKIVVVEDHPMFRERLAEVINGEQDMELAGCADRLVEAIRVIRATRPDLALVDISLNGASGLVLIREMRAQSIVTPVLVLSMHPENLYSERAIRAGASGYITKHRASSDVLFAIRRVLGGGVYFPDDRASERRAELGEGGGARTSHRVGNLTERELEVFRWIGCGRTTKEIAQEMELGVASVDTYRARIKEKLRLRNATELLHSAMRWVLETGQET